MIWRRLSLAWLVFLTAMNVYRAVAWPIAIDEARLFIDYLDHPFDTILANFDAGNHVLQTVFARLAVAMLGRAEWVVRLPTLIAGVFYLAAVWRLARLLAGGGARFLIAVVLLSAHPLILDYLTLARGYGLALTFFAWGFYEFLRAVDLGDQTRAVRGAYLLSFSVASNLTFGPPVAGLLAIFAAAWIHRKGWSLRFLVERLLLPATLPAFFITLLPLLHYQSGVFYYGTPTLRAALDSLAVATLAWTATALLPLAVVTGVIWALAWRQSDSPARRALNLAAGTLLLSILAAVAAHRFAGVPYPAMRTGLCWIWLFLIAAIAAWRVPFKWPAWRFAQWLPAALLAALALRFLTPWSVGYYLEFQEHREIRQAVEQLRALQGTSAHKARIGGSWEFEAGLNYYRRRNRLRWMEPVDRNGLAAGFDYYVFIAYDAAWIDRLRLHRVWTGPLSGIVVAVP